MNKIIKNVALLGVVSVGLVYAENAGVVQPIPNSESPISQNQRVVNNFKKIEQLFVSINKKIGKIDKLRKDISIMIANKDTLVLCSVIDSLDRDINQLNQEIEGVKDNEKRTKMQTRLDEYISVRDKEKSKLDQPNNVCKL